MPVIVAVFVLIPLFIASVLQYVVCYKTRRWYYRAIPAVVVLAVGSAVAYGRAGLWTSETVGPLTQLLFFPGLPLCAVLVGLLLGRHKWRRRWMPRVVPDKNKKKKGEDD